MEIITEMKVFEKYLESIENLTHKERTKDILKWVIKEYPQLNPKIAWNQPMFTKHDTYIIGFSVSKNHLAVSPELAGINYFLVKC